MMENTTSPLVPTTPRELLTVTQLTLSNSNAESNTKITPTSINSSTLEHRNNRSLSFLSNTLFVAVQLLIYFEISNASTVPIMPNVGGLKLGGISMECGNVFLTVSSLSKSSRSSSNDNDNSGARRNTVKDSELEMNWDTDCENAPEWSIPNWIGLFKADPIDDPLQTPLVKIETKDFPRGYFRTGISFGKPSFPNGWNKEPSITSNDNLDNNDDYVPHSTQNLEFGPQCMSYWIASYKDGNLIKASCLKIQPSWMYDHRLWINHDMIRVTPLLPVIRDLRRFLEVAKGEVVILDFHRFPVGFEKSPERHKVLLEMLDKELGHLILPPMSSDTSEGPSLNDIWGTGKQLIITYGDDKTVQETPWLWRSLPQAWGNKQTPNDLKTYLQSVMINPPKNYKNPMWAAMAQLTPSTLDVLLPGSLRNMADLINRNLTTWTRTKWWRLANIIATDFFLGNNLIDVAINSNVYKGKNL